MEFFELRYVFSRRKETRIFIEISMKSLSVLFNCSSSEKEKERERIFILFSRIFRGSWNYALVKEKKKKKRESKIYSERERKKFVEMFLLRSIYRRHEISALRRPKGTSLKAFAITNGNQRYKQSLDRGGRKGLKNLGYLSYYLSVRTELWEIRKISCQKKKKKNSSFTIESLYITDTTLSTRWTELIFLLISPLITFSRKLTQANDT